MSKKNTGQADPAGKNSAFKTPGTNASFGADNVKIFLPFIVDQMVDRALALVPEGSTLDQVMAKYQKESVMIVGIAEEFILKFTNLPDIADDFIAAASAEFVRALKARYDGEGKSVVAKVAKTGSPSIKDLLGLLPEEDFNKLMVLVKDFNKSAIDKFLNYSFGLKQEDSVKALTGLARVEKAGFDLWFNSCFPKTKRKVKAKESELEKSVKAGFQSLKKDVEGVLEKPSFLERMAQQKTNLVRT